jgi:hypothetical protein
MDQKHQDKTEKTEIEHVIPKTSTVEERIAEQEKHRQADPLTYDKEKEALRLKEQDDNIRENQGAKEEAESKGAKKAGAAKG